MKPRYEGPFSDGELCDGKDCAEKGDCARYMGGVDIHAPAVNHYVVGNRDSWPFGICLYYLDKPDPRYPQKTEQPCPDN